MDSYLLFTCSLNRIRRAVWLKAIIIWAHRENWMQYTSEWYVILNCKLTASDRYPIDLIKFVYITKLSHPVKIELIEKTFNCCTTVGIQNWEGSSIRVSSFSSFSLESPWSNQYWSPTLVRSMTMVTSGNNKTESIF